MTYYCVFKLCKLENLEAPTGAVFVGSEGFVGFLPVFSTREDAIEFAGDQSIVQKIEETPDYEAN